MRLAALDIAMQNPFAGTLADDESVTQNLMAQSVTLLPGIFSAKSNLTTLIQYLSMPLLYHYNAKQMLNIFRTILDCNKIIEHIFLNIPI